LSKINLKTVENKVHKIRVKLHPSFLPKTEGTFMARTVNEASLTIDEICDSLVNRGGFTGNHDDLRSHSRLFIEEVIYQLFDGFGVDLDYFSLYPNIGGLFANERETRDKKKHPVSIRFRTNSKLRKLINNIEVSILGVADNSGYIARFYDCTEEAENSVFSPNNLFCITGHRIKIVGDDPDCGLYFVPVDDPSKALKVKHFAENSPTKIIGNAPKTDQRSNRLEIRTQFTGSSSIFLKTPRVIKSSFTIEIA
jgi:hypothetical protein